MKKKKQLRVAWTLAAVIIIGAVVGYNYYIDQIKIKGGIFSDQIESIQSDLKKLQTEFFTSVSIYKENDITKEEFLQYAKEHFENMEEIIGRYDTLEPPPPFISSVELFKLSTQSQLEADKQLALWIETGDESYDIRSNELYQESLSFEAAALSDFKSAQLGKNP